MRGQADLSYRGETFYLAVVADAPEPLLLQPTTDGMWIPGSQHCRRLGRQDIPAPFVLGVRHQLFGITVVLMGGTALLLATALLQQALTQFRLALAQAINLVAGVWNSRCLFYVHPMRGSVSWCLWGGPTNSVHRTACEPHATRR